MKIGIYDPYLDDLGGGEKYMMTIAQVLSEDNEVSVFWNNPQDLKSLNQRFALDMSRIKIAQNIFSPTFPFLKRLIESRKYDEIIFLSDGSIPFLLSKKIYIHIQQPLKMLQKGSLKNNFKIRKVTGFFCNSEYTKTFINEKFGLKTTVLYPPVELKPKNLKKENIILHVGRFRIRNVKIGDYKKQSLMIKVFKEMVKEGLKNWKFVLAVSVKPENRKDMDELVKSCKGYPVEFLINKSNDQLWEIYSKAKIYWHASGFGEDLKKNPEFAEHFGISTVEAMGGGVVPVVINAGGQREIVKDGQDGYLWDTTSELKKYTLKLTEDELLISKLSKNAIKKAQYFAGNRFENEVRRLFK